MSRRYEFSIDSCCERFMGLCVLATESIAFDGAMELYDDIDIVQRNNGRRLRQLGHVVRMDENMPALKVFDAINAGESRRRRRPPLRLREQVEKDLAALGASNC
uniref:Uncharacterized protein n=1 Tax=Bactrocera dorsalis TaxID=27457 RepID=A0A034VNI6_BACDO